jgi:hypothetical protein
VCAVIASFQYLIAGVSSGQVCAPTGNPHHLEYCKWNGRSHTRVAQREDLQYQEFAHKLKKKRQESTIRCLASNPLARSQR